VVLSDHISQGAEICGREGAEAGDHKRARKFAGISDPRGQHSPTAVPAITFGASIIACALALAARPGEPTPSITQQRIEEPSSLHVLSSGRIVPSRHHGVSDGDR
jgi:hypothetical protein